MIKDGYAKELHRLLGAGKSLSQAARMTDMDRKTARKYRDDQTLPSDRKRDRSYRTRIDPFADVWIEVQRRLEAEPRLKAYTLFDWLQQEYPGQFPDSTKRTFERRVRKWRLMYGPEKNVIIQQVHRPGQFAASDFTVCNSLAVTIAGVKFNHSLFHCVLTYSNYESVSLCFSESFEALSGGIQDAFWKFGGVPQTHRTDSLAAAIRNHSSKKQLTDRYAGLMNHYQCQPQKTNARCANENGDVESLNGKIKDRLEQALLLRGSRDFASRGDYIDFIDQVVERANANRLDKFREDQNALSPLPATRLDTDDHLSNLKVSKHSTIHVRSQVYSVPSRLMDARVNVRLSAEKVTVSLGDQIIETIPRLIGKDAVSINYRHIIDTLVRKPGAFENFRYREEMFPRTIFRVAYDALAGQHNAPKRDRIYLQILHLAATENEEAVATALTHLIDLGERIGVAEVRDLIDKATQLPLPTDIGVPEPDLSLFDELLSPCGEASMMVQPSPSDENAFPNDKECHDDQDVQSIPLNEDHQVNVDHERSCNEDFPSEANDVGTARQTGRCTGVENGPEPKPDRSIPGATSTELSGSFSGLGGAGGSGAPVASGLSGGTDDVGDRGPARRPHPPVDVEVETSS